MPTVNPSQASLVPPQVHQHTTRITRATLEASLPHLRAALTAATFIAVDAEFSGLPPGGPDAGSSGNIATRYAKLREHVASHALLSIGIAAFRPAQAAGGGAGAGAGPRGAGAEAASSSSSSSLSTTGPSPPSKAADAPTAANLSCSLFEIALLPSRPFTLSPSSLTFLVDHGFDFTHHFAVAIPYTPTPHLTTASPTPPSTSATAQRPTPSQEPTAQPPAPPPAPPPPPHRALQRELAAHLLSHPTAPLVLHNGLLDLMFLYHAFYAPLPETLDVFVNNIADLRGGSRGGLYDTKYVAEFGQAERVSWLGYLFRRAEREMGTPAVVGGDCGIGSGGNAAQPWRGESAAASWRQALGNQDEDTLRWQKKRKAEDGLPFCSQYAYHGYCEAMDPPCAKPHDLDVALDYEAAEKARRQRKRKRTATVVGDDDGVATGTEAGPSTDEGTNGDASGGGSGSNDGGTSLDDNSKTNSSASNSSTSTANNSNTRHHSASHDAFMTGSVFAHQLASTAGRSGGAVWATPTTPVLQAHKNRIYLMGKVIGLHIFASSFSRCSKAHVEARERLAREVEDTGKREGA